MVALEILSRHRAGETPVVVARNLGRPGDTVSVVSLARLDPETVDMLTLLLIGSRETRLLQIAGKPPRVYTPRGYATKSAGRSGDEGAS